jgi:membrane protein implicated in regulation of membrane protease activity
MNPAVIWLIVGLALLIVELFTTTFFLMWIAAGALLTALLAVWVDISWVQWVVFAVTSSILLIVTRPLARSVHGQVTVPSNVDALVGQEVMVLETVDSDANTGRVRIHSEEWRARSEAVIPQGSKAIIESVRGTTLIVGPKAVAKAETGETDG